MRVGFDRSNVHKNHSKFRTYSDRMHDIYLLWQSTSQRTTLVAKAPDTSPTSYLPIGSVPSHRFRIISKGIFPDRSWNGNGQRQLLLGYVQHLGDHLAAPQVHQHRFSQLHNSRNTQQLLICTDCFHFSPH